MENTPCGPPSGCFAWKGPNCSRLPTDPDSTELSFSYVFGSDVPVTIMPPLNLDWSNGGEAVAPTLQCGPS